MIMTAARVLAFAIAIVAVLDPSLTGPRSSRPMVSVIASDSLMDASVVDATGKVEGKNVALSVLIVKAPSKKFLIVLGMIVRAESE